MNDYLFNKKIKSNLVHLIKKELGAINESYVAQQKKFDVKTDFLSDSNIQNHISLYKGYVESFNQISAQLDAVDRSRSNSNNSESISFVLEELYISWANSSAVPVWEA